MPSPSPKTTTTKTDPTIDLAAALEALRLPRTAEDLDDFLARATKRRWSPRVVLEELAREEHAERERRSLERAGVPTERIEHAASEMDAVRTALEWARPGDLLLLLLHAQREDVLALLARRAARG